MTVKAVFKLKPLVKERLKKIIADASLFVEGLDLDKKIFHMSLHTSDPYEELRMRTKDQEYWDAIDKIADGWMKKAIEKAAKKVVKSFVESVVKALAAHNRCNVTRKDFLADVDRQYEELGETMYYPELPGYDPYNYIGKVIMIEVIGLQIDEALQ